MLDVKSGGDGVGEGRIGVEVDVVELGVGGVFIRWKRIVVRCWRCESEIGEVDDCVKVFG